MFRFLILTTALMLTLFVSVSVDVHPQTDSVVGYTAFDEDSVYAGQKHEEKKFLSQKDFVVVISRATYFSATLQVSAVVHTAEVQNIRGPPAIRALV